MSGRTPIQWTDTTWNPVMGCRRVSPGCENCYAERIAARFSGPGQPFAGIARRRSNGEAQWTGASAVNERTLTQPLHWRRPRRVFVNSMSDLFYEQFDDATIDRVFGVMAQARQHTYQVLTKRPERMREYVAGLAALAPRNRSMRLARSMYANHPMRSIALSHLREEDCGELAWPLPNVWLGTSIESQEYIGRFDELRDTPAAVHFLSLEPLLSYVDLYDRFAGLGPTDAWWVIVGGESGPNARPFDVHWIAGIQRACNEFAVPLFVKQLGAKPGFGLEGEERRGNLVPSFHHFDEASGLYIKKLRDSHGGDMAEWPEEYRVREFPEPEVRHG